MTEKPSESWARKGFKVVDGELKRISDERTTDIRASAKKGGRVDILTDDPGKAPVVERDIGIGDLGKVCLQKETGRRFLVHVKSYRRRLLDFDNLCPKFHIDLLRNSGALLSDAPGTTAIEVSQEKVGSKEREFTRIEVFRLA